MSKQDKKYTKDDIKQILAGSDLAVMKGFIRIWQLQTESEKATESTMVHNGVGFSGYDGTWMTSIGNNVIKYGQITEGQLNAVKKMMHKYAGQLAKIANGEITVPEFPTMKENWLRKKRA